MTRIEKIEGIYRNLIADIGEIEDIYISSLLTTNNPANATLSYDQFKYGVKSYIILCHAAMEEYAENLSGELIDALTATYYSSGDKIYQVAFHLQGFYGYKLPEDKDKAFKLSSARFRTTIDDLKTKFSHDIRENHGVGLKYLKFMFYATGIDIKTDDTNLISSLERMQKYRGDVAHKTTISDPILRVLSPDDAKQIVGDCILLMESAKKSAISILKPFEKRDESLRHGLEMMGGDIY